MNGDGHHINLDISDLTATEAVAVIMVEMRRITAALHEQSHELARLREAVRRPDRVIYRPKEVARRLGFKSDRTIRTLWNDGKLAYKKDGRGRYSTEAQVQAYLRDFVYSA